MPLDLRDKDIALIREIAAGLPAIEEVRVFGSRATGTSRRSSDLDLAVSAPGLDPGGWARVVEAFDESALIYILDVVQLEELPPGAFADEVRRNGVAVYRRDQGVEPTAPSD